jgi:hypothetical protein
MNEIVDLVILIFVTRNTRGGKGEKLLSFRVFLELWDMYPLTAKSLLHLFPHFGYWKDLLLLMDLARNKPFGKELRSESLQLIKAQWQLDLAALEVYRAKTRQASDDAASPKVEEDDNKGRGPAISLLAKWLPREGKNIDKRIHFVQEFATMVYPSAAAVVKANADNDSAWKSSAKSLYRKQTAELTSFLELPEVLLAAQRADEIRIQRVASRATKLLSKAFLNEDKAGNTRSEDAKRIKLKEIFIDHIVRKGLKGGQVMPHELVATIRNAGTISRGMELALDAQWKDIWRTVVDQVQAKAAEEGLEFNPTRMVPIVDVSGSMDGTPIEVAIALGIGISEITHEGFRDRVLTFSKIPEWHYLDPKATIVEKVRSMESATWGMSTDFAKAYDLILKVCLDHNLKREDMPALIVFSDMQFDEAAGIRGSSSCDTMFQIVRGKVAEVARRLEWVDQEPTPIVFWNLENTGGHPVDKGTEGAVLLSGFSPSLLKLVMQGEALKEEEVIVVQSDGTVVTEKIRVTPEEILKRMLHDSLYDPVRKILAASQEGVFGEFEFELLEQTASDEDNDGDGDDDGFERIG